MHQVAAHPHRYQRVRCIVYLSGEDVVRHKLVRRILEAYGDIQ